MENDTAAEGYNNQVPTMIAEIRAVFSEANYLLGKSREALYDALDKINVYSGIIKEHEDLRNALLDIARNDPFFRNGGHYDANEKRPEALLIALGQGIDDTKSSRSRYLKAIMASRVIGNVPQEPGRLKSWLRANDGVTKAGNLLDEKKSEPTLEELAASLPEDSAPELDISMWGLEDVPAGAFLLYVSPSQGDEDHRRVHPVRKESLVRMALEEALGEAGIKVYSEEEQRRVEVNALWTLNKLMLKEAGIIASRPSWKDKLSFQRALNDLRNLPARVEPYFLEEPSVEISNGLNEKKNKKGETRVQSWMTIAVQNPGFHELDPGRYIKGAKEGALVPYRIYPDKKTWEQEGARQYVEEHRRPTRDKPEPPENPGTLNAFLEAEEASMIADDATKALEDQLR